MSDLIADIFIYLLLLAGVGFGGIALMGLLIFPDIRSRMYTALRASLICMAAVIGAAAVYTVALWSGTGGEQYLIFLIHTIFLTGMMGIAITAIGRLVREKTRKLVYCASAEPKASGPDQH